MARQAAGRQGPAGDVEWGQPAPPPVVEASAGFFCAVVVEERCGAAWLALQCRRRGRLVHGPWSPES